MVRESGDGRGDLEGRRRVYGKEEEVEELGYGGEKVEGAYGHGGERRVEEKV